MPYITEVMPDLSYRFLDSSRYQLFDPLGAGAYGVVYRAREYIPNCAHSVMRAIKVAPHFSVKGPHGMAQHMREVKLHKTVSSHPNVVPVHRVFKDKHFLYIVMDYCSGGDLLKAIRKKRILARNDAMVKHIFLQILDGVDGCHAENVFHRDLKPENILVNEGVTKAWIGDFGLATNLTESISFNTGSKYYMSPECVGCDDRYPYDTRRSDIWALGLILLHMVTGRLPWHTATPEDPCFAAFLEDPDFLRHIFPISQSLNLLLRRVLTIVPNEAISLPEFRRCVHNMETFWMTEKEVCASNATVQHMWASYQRRSRNKPASSSSSGDSDSDSDSEWDGDVLATETSSESSRVDESNRADSHMPGYLGATTRSLNMAEEGRVGNVPSPLADPPLPQVATRPAPYACSSDEFPIRNPRSRPACALGVTISSTSDSDGYGPSATSGSSASSDCGPVTPETRPQDPPEIVVVDVEPLDQSSGQVEKETQVVLPAKGHNDSLKAPGGRKIGRLFRQFVPRWKSC